ncbi:DUF896 domain-containing protein, partial [Desulforamulus aquiferis]
TAEKEEQHNLRQEYLKGIRGQVEQSLSQIKFVEDEPSCGCGSHHHKKKNNHSCGCGSHSKNNGPKPIH